MNETLVELSDGAQWRIDATSFRIQWDWIVFLDKHEAEIGRFKSENVTVILQIKKEANA